MARLSMPARKPRTSTSSASSSSRKQTAGGSKKRQSTDEKRSSSRQYASVLVGELFDKLVDDRLPEIKKNRNTVNNGPSLDLRFVYNLSIFGYLRSQVTKWLSKARMSVLKKISESSKVIFSEAPPDYSQEIAELKGEIRELRNKVFGLYCTLRITPSNRRLMLYLDNGGCQRENQSLHSSARLIKVSFLYYVMRHHRR